MSNIPDRDITAIQRLFRTRSLAQATAALQRAVGDSTATTLALSGANRLNRFITAGARPKGSSPPNGPSAIVEIEPTGDQFTRRSYHSEAGSRTYKLYVPSAYRGEALPLIVMLHGCTQSPDDFATGTRMNTLAEERLFFVAYPEQAVGANPSKCWNWFDANHQRRDIGEPGLIAGVTHEVMHDYAVDPLRVYVAGLSAGGAAAAVLGTTYPDLYAAIGIHSGLPCGSASNVSSAFIAMRSGAPIDPRGVSERVPIIVFHGDRDTTVHPSNSDRIIAAAIIPELRATERAGVVTEGHPYRCIRYADAAGRIMLEQWVIHGAGHAWSGGSPAGSYTDPQGPDASREMVRFFLAHSLV